MRQNLAIQMGGRRALDPKPKVAFEMQQHMTGEMLTKCNGRATPTSRRGGLRRLKGCSMNSGLLCLVSAAALMAQTDTGRVDPNAPHETKRIQAATAAFDEMMQAKDGGIAQDI